MCPEEDEEKSNNGQGRENTQSVMKGTRIGYAASLFTTAFTNLLMITRGLPNLIVHLLYMYLYGRRPFVRDAGAMTDMAFAALWNRTLSSHQPQSLPLSLCRGCATHLTKACMSA